MIHLHSIYIKGACLLLMLGGATSCNDWLDVQPASQVEDTELFTTENGFKEALAGVYSSMVSTSTYGMEMTFGTMAVLGHEWSNLPSSSVAANAQAYETLAEYDYSSSLSEGVIASIWATSYNGIANVNNLLNHIDTRQSLFSNNNYAIIKGEALALRAFLHFDLLRCFGVSYAVNSNMPSIPYCTDLTYRVFPQLTVQEVAASIEADLLEAEQLLQVDPILTGEEITELDDNGYLMNRQVHLNYYAVKALQARLYMWMQRYGDAEAAAEEVINSGAFPWAELSVISVGHDYGFATEQIFALNNTTLSTVFDTYFDPEADNVNFSLTSTALSEYFENITTDYRYLYQWRSGTQNEAVNNRYLLKYSNPTINSGETFEESPYYSNKMPLIRVGEMYLILAECRYREGGDALAMLNELRTARSSSPLSTLPTDFYAQLINEYRRELFAEGQLFFLYKRLNLTNVSGSEVDMVAQRAYTFPLPVSETDPAQRENNR